MKTTILVTFSFKFIFFLPSYNNKLFAESKILFTPVYFMKPQNQNNLTPKLTIFKPPAYIYKLTKNQSKNNKKLAYDIYYNKENSLRKYTQTINLANQAELMLYEWRKHSTSAIVKVMYVELIQKSPQCSTPVSSLIDVNVYTEHIQKILADMINLTLNQAIYVLQECILAFRDLFNKFSAVSINKFHIGLNAEGKLKVWINQNFAINRIQDKPTQAQPPYNQSLIVQTAIVNKIIHMIGLLSSINCKYFFFGLEKELTLKRFLFDNCLQYIRNFVANTNNFEVPNNLAYMLPKKTSFCLEKSSIRSTVNAQHKIVNRERKLSQKNSFTNINTFKNFGSFVRMNNRENTENLKQNERVKEQKPIRSKRFSENLTSGVAQTAYIPKIRQKKIVTDSQDQNMKQNKISLQIIVQKNRKYSIKSTNILAAKKSNISLCKQRPSISIAPSFIMKSATKQIKQDNERGSSFDSQRKTQKSYSLLSRKSKDYHSLLGSKVSSAVRECRFANIRTSEGLNSKIYRQDHQNSVFRPNKQNKSKNNLNQSIRSRSASANIKFGSYKFPYHMLNLNQQKSQGFELLKKEGSDNKRSLQKNSTQKNQTDKVSTNSISNDGTGRKRSFLTKTNYDSITEENEKNGSFYRMNFSSMSIENRITNKNLDSDISSSQKQDIKRSLMSFKYGFEQILQNPSCKQVQEQNQSKSYNGSSLKNTQNISELISRKQKKNDETSLNSFSFGNGSNRQGRRINLKDSVEQNWTQIKQKNDELLLKNQWKKTINNLEQLQDLKLNQSFVQVCDSVIEKDRYPDIRLEKLDRLGRNMCFSILKKSDEGMVFGQLNGKRVFQA